MSRTLSPEDWDPQNNIFPIGPALQWAGQEGQDKLNAAYAEANWKEEFDAVTKLYAEHYKTGPFK
jgi:ribose transport system substrate-binding protein